MSILSFLSTASSSPKEDLCQLFHTEEHPVPQGAFIGWYEVGEGEKIFFCSIPRSDAWSHTSGMVAQAAFKSEQDMKKWHEKTHVTEDVRQGAADIAQARACVESSKETSVWAKAQIKLMDDECKDLGIQADKDLAAMQALLANW